MSEIVETRAGSVPRRREQRRDRVQGHSVRGRHQRGRTLPPAPTAAAMGGRARLPRLRTVVPTDRGRRDDRPGAPGGDRAAHGRVEPRARDGRGLPRPQRLDARPPATPSGRCWCGCTAAAWRVGSASWPLYDFTNLARNNDVVVVGVNHRLGVLGLPRPVAPRRRVRRLRQRRDARHRRRARVGARQHRASSAVTLAT